MATKTMAAFLAGVATGWGLRSILGSSREVVVRAIVFAHEAHDRVRRTVAERVEWLDDLFAEGRARYEEGREAAPLDHEAPPQVSDDARERAA
jgi:hypothetical protein